MSVLAITTQWVGLIGALGGVLITGCVGLATAVLTHRWQRQSTVDERHYQQREARASIQREAYSKYLAAYEAFENVVFSRPQEALQKGGRDLWSAISSSNPAAVDELDVTANLVRLLGSDPVVAALDAFTEAWKRELPYGDRAALRKAKEQLVAAMRRDPLIE